MDYLIKQGRIEHKKEHIDMGEFIQKRADYFQEVANLKHITLNTYIEKELEYYCSKTKLQRIVDNTISNAIKYSHDNTQVDITLKMKYENMLFEVKDQGVGIENVDRIFSRYYRENEAKGGFGIGLNIVKQIIDEEGIGLHVISTLGNGASFTYTFLAK
jgi:signal transduction histidine kinase